MFLLIDFIQFYEKMLSRKKKKIMSKRSHIKKQINLTMNIFAFMGSYLYFVH